jgi:hypothetical protein
MDKDKTLADLGEWPEIEISGHSRKVVRHAYERVLTACARLGSFATGTPTSTHGPINERQEALAADDLVDFAIHARRLIENTAKARRFSQATIRSMKREGEAHIKVTRVINMLVHHDYIQIVRTEVEAKILAGIAKAEDFFLSTPSRSFPPIVSVKSDKGKIAMFELRELIEAFQQQVLGPIIDICDANKLFLEDTDFD